MPSFSAKGKDRGEGLELLPNLQKGGLTGPQFLFLEGVAGKERVKPFRGGFQFLDKIR